MGHYQVMEDGNRMRQVRLSYEAQKGDLRWPQQLGRKCGDGCDHCAV